MILTIYITILSYFLLGGIGFYFINRKKDRKTAHQNIVKFITYFFIIHILFASIVIKPVVFQYLSILIIAVSGIELFRLFVQSGLRNKSFFTFSSVLFIILCTGFYLFSMLPMGIILFSFLILSIFDAFSQISGQLFGRSQIAPDVSPNKTFEGLLGGVFFALTGSVLLREITGFTVFFDLLLAAGIVFFAFWGDFASSLYKRKYGVKDYSSLLPGHGGFLDRFDSLIAGGAFVAMIAELVS